MAAEDAANDKADDAAGTASPPSAMPSPATASPGPTPSAKTPFPTPSSTPPAKSIDPDDGSRSEWTASDERGPLGRAEDARARGGAPELEEPAAAPQDEALGAALAVAAADGATRGDRPETDAEPASAGSEPPAAASPAETGASRNRSLGLVAAGVVVGAIVGAGSAIVYTSTAVDPQVASLATRVDALEHHPQATADGASAASVAALERKVAALQNAPPPAASAGSGPQANLQPLQKQVADLQGEVAALKGAGGDTQGLSQKVTSLEAAVAGMRKDASSAEAGVADVQGQEKALADKVMVPALAVAADSLVQQIDRGEPYATQVAALEALGADPAKVAILKQNADRGVPSAKVLAAKFAPLAEPIAASGHKPPPNAGFMDRLKSGMLSMVSVRSVDDTSGNDLPSRVARIRADLAHDDVAGALATWNALPDDARQGGQDWSLLAKAHVDAMSAARALQRDAIVALGAKKS